MPETDSLEFGTRQPWLDSLRVLAVIGVVVQHASVTRWMALTGISVGPRVLLGVASNSVSCLFLVAGYASALSASFGQRDRGYILKRLGRLGLPYVGWSAIFLVAQAYLPFGRPDPDLDVMSLLTGTGIYPVLWFLPALFFANLVGRTIRSQRWRLAVGAGMVALHAARDVVAGFYALDPSGVLMVIVKLSPWFALFLFGQAAASIPRVWLEPRRARVLLGGAGAAGLLGTGLLSAAYYPAWPSALATVSWALGAAAVLGLLLVASRSQRWQALPALSGVTLAIYMMHLPILSLVSRVAPIAIVPWYVWLPANVLLAVTASGAVGALVARTPLRFLVS